MFATMDMVGIGGSDLEPRALYLALAAYGIKARSVHFISNVDPDDAADEGDVIGVDTFGESAPANIIFEKHDLTVEHVVTRALSLLAKKSDRSK